MIRKSKKARLNLFARFFQKKMRIQIKNQKEIKVKKGKVFYVPFFDKEFPRTENLEIKEKFSKSSYGWKNLKEGESSFAVLEEAKFLFQNVGKKDKWNKKKFLLEIRKAERRLKESKNEEAVFLVENIIPSGIEKKELLERIVEDLIIADYDFLEYKEKPEKGWNEIKLIEISSFGAEEERNAIERAETAGSMVNFARDLSNIPGADATPDSLAKISISEARKIKKVKAKVFTERDLKRMGMEGILGVSRGSALKPRLIVLEYRGEGRKKTGFDLALVGKGVTFDSGGLSIKPTEGMLNMCMDMAGGAAAIAGIIGIAKTNLPLNAVALIPAVENMPSGQALRVGDIIKTYSGKTVEVANTDAEGRIILADALSYAKDKFNPSMIVDIATLTGASIAALGHRAAALFTNRPKLEKTFCDIGSISGDYAWPLPCWEEYSEEIKGNFADISNVGKIKGAGGAITAAVFLKEFVGELPWLHLDIAPTMTSLENQGLAIGSTGAGVRYLMRLAKDFSRIEKQL